MKAILKFIGEVYWPWPSDHIKETRERGPSVKIPPSAIPQLETPYPIIFVHPKGTFTVGNDMDIHDLVDELDRENHLLPNESAGNGYIDNESQLPTHKLIERLAQLDRYNRKEFDRLVDKYAILFDFAITHYSWVTGTQIVIGDDGTGLDLFKELTLQGLDVEPVKVVVIEDKEEEDAG